MALASEAEVVKDIARYSCLGLIANPFAVSSDSQQIGIDCEIAAEGNRLLAAILERSHEESPKPLWVEKRVGLPGYYHNAAMAHAESSLARDDSLNVLYAYVQLFAMRIGATRASLNILAERLSFRSFDDTLVAYLRGVLAEPDTSLTSYGLMGPERLDAFAARFEEDPLAAVHDVFGRPVQERRQELRGVIDVRQGRMEGDVLDEDEATPEVDQTLGEAPGTDLILAEREGEVEADEDTASVRDYLIEHTREHLSKVVARALRVYCDRGTAAMSTEFKVTKAPRKTLGAVAKLAGTRFRKVALLFDEFEQWSQIDADLRSKMVAAFSEIRWKLADDAFVVFFAAPDEAPELEETFRSGGVLSMTFAGLEALQQAPDALDREIVDRWLAAAAAPGADPLTMDDPVLAKLVETADGSLRAFVRMAAAAVEDAAVQGAASLDDQAYEAGVTKAS